MDHETATRMHATERYILGDFSSLERDEFEEHLSDCQRCMDDLAVTDIFAANSQAVFQDRAAGRQAAAPKRWLGQLRLRPVPALAFSAALNLLLLVFSGYGLLRFVPALQSRLDQSQSRFEQSQTRLEQSEARLHVSSIPGVSQVFRVRGISRGPQILLVFKSTPFVSLHFEFPRHYAQYSYSIDGATQPIHGPAGFLVPADADTLELIIPTAGFNLGDHLLKITGLEGAISAEIASCILRFEPSK